MDQVDADRMGGSAEVAPLKILYAAGLSPNDSSLYRLWALERLGHRVVPLNAFEYRAKSALLEKVRFRLAAGGVPPPGLRANLAHKQARADDTLYIRIGQYDVECSASGQVRHKDS